MDETLGVSQKYSAISYFPGAGKTAVESDPFAPNRLTWSSRYKCYQAYICYVMSYLSCLKFCERVGNYRVTIFIPYLLFNILIGVPALFVEIMLGRFVMGNVSEAWNMCPLARGVFWCLCIVTFYAIILNSLFNIHLMKYFFAGFTFKWGKCDQWWNKQNCYKIGRKSEAFAECLKTNSYKFCADLNWQTSGMQFWLYVIQSNYDVTQVCLSFLFLVTTILLVSFIIYKGIMSLERTLSLLVYPSVLLWAILVIVSFSSPHALDGLKRLFEFSWTQFINPEMWVDAFEDTFYLLGLGRLALSFISSHGNFTDNILFDVVIVIFGSIVSCLLIITPVLSVIEIHKSVGPSKSDPKIFKNVSDVFVSISEVFLFYPFPQSLWSCLYYLDCFLISLSSMALLVLAFCEAMEGAIVKKEKTSFKILITVSAICLIVASSLQFVEHIEETSHSTIVVTTVWLSTITWQIFYGIRKFNYDYYFMLGYPVPVFLKFTWVTLAVLPFTGLILKMYFATKIPNKWIVFVNFGITVFVYVLFIVINIFKFHVQKKKISRVFMENPNWGPESALLKQSREVFDTSIVTREFMYRQELSKKPFQKLPDFSEQNIVQLL